MSGALTGNMSYCLTSGLVDKRIGYSTTRCHITSTTFLLNVGLTEFMVEVP